MNNAMMIKLRYSENKKKIIASLKDQECELAELVLAIMFGKEEQTFEMLGEDPLEVIIDDVSDEKLEKEAEKFKELLNKIYQNHCN